MTDPVVSVALYAETRGYYSFENYSRDRKDEIARKWCFGEARRELSYRGAALDAQRLFAEMAIPSIDPEGARSIAKGAFKKARGVLKPWIIDKAALQAETFLDLKALWYIMNAPQKLQEHGVEIAQPESGH